MVPWVRSVGLEYDGVVPSYNHISIWLFTTIVKELFLSIFHSGECAYQLPVIFKHPLSFTFAKTVHN